MKVTYDQYLRLSLTLIYLLTILVHQMIVVHLLVVLFFLTRHYEGTAYALDYSV